MRVSGSGIELRGVGRNSDYVEIPREEDHVQGRETFNFGLTVDPAKGSKGTFLEVGRVLEAKVTKSGAVEFSLATLDTKGKGATVESAEGVFGDGGAHHLNFVYDGAALKLFVDGELADQAALTGRVVDGGWYGLRIGNFWGGGGFEGEVSNVLMRGEPSSDEVVAKAYGVAGQERQHPARALRRRRGLLRRPRAVARARGAAARARGAAARAPGAGAPGAGTDTRARTGA